MLVTLTLCSLSALAVKAKEQIKRFRWTAACTTLISTLFACLPTKDHIPTHNERSCTIVILAHAQMVVIFTKPQYSSFHNTALCSLGTAGVKKSLSQSRSKDVLQDCGTIHSIQSHNPLITRVVMWLRSNNLPDFVSQWQTQIVSLMDPWCFVYANTYAILRTEKAVNLSVYSFFH